ncbi:hypothetical protein ACP275_14G076200 [Erythranthe tilingii]
MGNEERESRAPLWWTRRNLALAGIFGIAVPVLVYKGIVKDFFIHGLLKADITVGTALIEKSDSHGRLGLERDWNKRDFASPTLWWWMCEVCF